LRCWTRDELLVTSHASSEIAEAIEARSKNMHIPSTLIADAPAAHVRQPLRIRFDAIHHPDRLGPDAFARLDETVEPLRMNADLHIRPDRD